MQTKRATFNLDVALLDQLRLCFPGKTRTALIDEGLRALLAAHASYRLIVLGGAGPEASAPPRRRLAAKSVS